MQLTFSIRASLFRWIVSTVVFGHLTELARGEGSSVKMDKAYEYAKSAIVNFRLDTCCCFAPIRVGVLMAGYFNLFIALLSLVGTADGGITPPLMEVQDSFLEDQQSKPAGIIAYAAELTFSAILLCAMYRNDIVLLRVYIYFLMGTIVTSLLVYSMVIAAVSLLTKLTIISNMVFNCYVIILVRSAIVEIKENQSSEKNGHVVLYSVSRVPHEDEKKVPDVEAPSEPSDDVKDKKHGEQSEELKKDDKTDETHVRLETASENPKEE